MSALCIQLLVDRGEIDVGSAVSRYWPEFAAAGKESVTVANVLSHCAGLPYWKGFEQVAYLDDPASFTDTGRIALSLAQAAPVIRPSDELAYHAITYGWLLDEIVLRVTGQHLGERFDELLARPLGLNIRIGPSPNAIGRPAPLGLIELDPTQLAEVVQRNRSTMRGKAMLFRRAESAVEVDHFANDRAFIECGQPAVGGLSDAKSLARAYGLQASGGTLDGIKYLSRQSIEQFSSTVRQGYDLVLDRQVDRALGYLRNLDGQDFGPPANAFGHNGLGGSMAFADADANVGFGFVTNGLDLSLNGGERGLRMSRALYGCL
jgi:CubicO group peptidase (beta-lactamase class C family)